MGLRYCAHFVYSLHIYSFAPIRRNFNSKVWWFYLFLGADISNHHPNVLYVYIYMPFPPLSRHQKVGDRVGGGAAAPPMSVRAGGVAFYPSPGPTVIPYTGRVHPQLHTQHSLWKVTKRRNWGDDRYVPELGLFRLELFVLIETVYCTSSGSICCCHYSQ